jgi:hypothetical protein
MTDDLSKETGQGAADIVFDAIAFGPGVCGLVVTSKKDNGIPWGGVGILLEYYDAHHVSDNLSGKFEWVDMDHTLFAFIVEALSNIVINLFSDVRVEFFPTDLPPTFQGVAVTAHAIFEAGIRVVGSVVRLSVDKVAD